MQALFEALMKGHDEAARENKPLSTTLAYHYGAAGVPYQQMIAAVSLSFGASHGPVEQARRVLFFTPTPLIQNALDDGLIIPGFGNAFHKDGIDPAFRPFFELLDEEYLGRLAEVGGLIGARTDKVVYPNPAAFTACMAHIMNAPLGTELEMLYIARIPVWTQYWNEGLQSEYKPLYQGTDVLSKVLGKKSDEG